MGPALTTAARPAGEPGGVPSAPTAVRVLPDVTGVDRCFDYVVPAVLADRAVVGALVRVPLHGRRVRGWIVEAEVDPPAGVTLLELAEVVSLGPPPGVVALGRYGAWRYAGRLRPFLVAGSPPRDVRTLPPPAPPRTSGPGLAATIPAVADAVGRALALDCAVVRLPPAAARLDVVDALLAAVGGDGGSVLILTPERREAEVLARRLERRQIAVARLPDQWAAAAGGGRVVIGNRAGALAPVRDLRAVLVLDAHAEAYVDPRAPTWNATVLVAERARRAGVPCVLVSACPTLELLAMAPAVELGRPAELAGWPPVEVVDRRDEDPRSGRYSPRLAPLIAAALDEQPSVPVVCVLNRTGRARLLACGGCGELLRCGECGAALAQLRRPAPGLAGELECPSGHGTRPALCPHCGSIRLRTLRVGVDRAAEELAALTGRAVTEVSGPAPRGGDEPAELIGLVVGTEAVLHRVRHASVVVFLDLDQELLAPRFRAAEQALALVARAARLVGTSVPAAAGSRRAPGRIIIQTRLPDHEVVEAALHGDPTRLAAAEAPRRAALGLPPTRALALISGDGADALAARLGGEAEVAPLGAERFLVRAASPAALADALAAASEPGSGPRIAVDPLSL